MEIVREKFGMVRSPGWRDKSYCSLIQLLADFYAAVAGSRLRPFLDLFCSISSLH